MVVIKKEKKWVYDYMSPCYKAVAQKTYCMNTIHPMETHDIGFIDDQMGSVVGGDALDEDFNRRILLPTNPQKRGQGKNMKRCSKCGQVGLYKSTCRNSRADFNAKYEGDLVTIEDLLGENYSHCM